MKTKQRVLVTGPQDKLEIMAENVGEDLMIHRSIERDGFDEAGNVKRSASGDTWTVSLRVAGFSIVTGIENRLQARETAKRLGPVVAAFRAIIEGENEKVDLQATWGDTSLQFVGARNVAAVQALADQFLPKGDLADADRGTNVG